MDSKAKAVPRGISLTPDQWKHLARRSADTGLTKSRIVQILLDHDRDTNVIGDAIVTWAREAT